MVFLIYKLILWGLNKWIYLNIEPVTNCFGKLLFSYCGFWYKTPVFYIKKTGSLKKELLEKDIG
jgi:hypothetical protein